MKIVFTIDKKMGKAIDEPRAEFITEGKFLKLWPEPRFTRTGAVLVIREHLLERNPFEEEFEAWTELRRFVLHNPHAPVQMPQEPWGQLSPACVRRRLHTLDGRRPCRRLSRINLGCWRQRAR
jgi:hypothetical protein